MTIYILDNDPKKCAEMLDDKSLERMIRDIAQVLCDVHHFVLHKQYDIGSNRCVEDMEMYHRELDKIPLDCHAIESKLGELSRWARECRANYEYLQKLLDSLLKEHRHRFGIINITSTKPASWVKWQEISNWARDNVPDLSDGKINDNCHDCNNDDIGSYGNPCDSHAWTTTTPLPLVMPKKYNINFYNLGFSTDQINNCVLSYREYYRAKVHQKLKNYDTCRCERARGIQDPYCTLPKWTRRTKPEWLEL